MSKLASDSKHNLLECDVKMNRKFVGIETAPEYTRFVGGREELADLVHLAMVTINNGERAVVICYFDPVDD